MQVPCPTPVPLWSAFFEMFSVLFGAGPVSPFGALSVSAHEVDQMSRGALVFTESPWGSSPDSSSRKGVWWSDYCCWLTSISFARLCEVGQLGWCWHADMGVILIYFGCRSNLGVCTKVHCSGHICGLRHPLSLSMCKHCCHFCCINTQGLYRWFQVSLRSLPLVFRAVTPSPCRFSTMDQAFLWEWIHLSLLRTFKILHHNRTLLFPIFQIKKCFSFLFYIGVLLLLSC